jgi:hypothetical protein
MIESLIVIIPLTFVVVMVIRMAIDQLSDI